MVRRAGLRRERQIPNSIGWTQATSPKRLLLWNQWNQTMLLKPQEKLSSTSVHTRQHTHYRLTSISFSGFPLSFCICIWHRLNSNEPFLYLSVSQTVQPTEILNNTCLNDYNLWVEVDQSPSRHKEGEVTLAARSRKSQSNKKIRLI